MNNCLDKNGNLNAYINLEGVSWFAKKGLAGISGAYHLDHVVSKFEGFINNVPPFIIGSKYNLKYVPREHNLQKNRKSDLTVEQLLDLYYEEI